MPVVVRCLGSALTGLTRVRLLSAGTVFRSPSLAKTILPRTLSPVNSQIAHFNNKAALIAPDNRFKPWSPEEDAMIHSMREENAHWDVIARTISDRFGYFRTSAACKDRFSNLKNPVTHSKTHMKKPWTRSEDNLLIELCEKGYTWRQIAEKLGRTVDSCETHHRRMRAKADNENHAAKWTEQDDARIKELVDKALSADKRPNWAEIGRDIGRLADRVRRRYYDHLIGVKKGAWDEDEDAILIEEVKKQLDTGADIDWWGIGEQLQRSKKQVKERWARLEARREREEYYERNKQ